MKRAAAVTGWEPEPAPRRGRLAATARHAVAAIRHWRALATLWNAAPGSVLDRLLRARPEIWTMASAPFLAVDWSPARRIAQIADHCRIAAALGPPFNLGAHEYAELALVEIGADYRLTIDQPRWMIHDGLLVMSLWEGNDRIYSLAFLFSEQDDRLTAYIGGIQGRRGQRSLERYHAFTKRACGVRPPDMLVELFRMLCEELGVKLIRGVADANRHQRSPFFQRRQDFIDPVRFDYDALWRERGGLPTGDGFFDLAVKVPARPDAEIAPRKRSLYRRRRSMMAAIRTRLSHAIVTGEGFTIDQHEPAFLT